MSFYKYAIVVCAGICLRSTISLHSYSGEKISPLFGDYEAQRHWQEITVNLPIKDWYENTTDNDLLYWGLDYPPLTAYHSYLIGHAAKIVNSSFVELHKSRGISTENHKLFMRLSVLAADLLIYIPSLLIACNVIFFNVLKMNKQKSEAFHWLYISTATFYSGQILIDNGHFQYNNISLGFVVIAVASILCDRRIIGAIFFVLALNYKQMELYHAVPFFCYLLSNCFVEYDNERYKNIIFKFNSYVMINFIYLKVLIYERNIKTFYPRLCGDYFICTYLVALAIFIRQPPSARSSHLSNLSWHFRG